MENWEKLLYHPKLGEILLQHKKITISQLSIALEEQEDLQIPLGQILMQMKIISENELYELLKLKTDIDSMIKESYSEIKDNNQK